MANRSLCTNQAVYMIFIFTFFPTTWQVIVTMNTDLFPFLLIFFFFWGGRGGKIIFIYKLGSDAWNLCSSHRFFRICRVVGLIDSLPDFQCPTSGSSQRPNSCSQCVNQPYITPLNRFQEQVEKTKCRIHFYREFLFISDLASFLECHSNEVAAQTTAIASVQLENTRQEKHST